jgi:hypothetical protein
MKVFVITGILAVGVASTASSQTQRRDLVRACVEVSTAELQMASKGSERKAGGVTCPSGDIVGFPPRERRHNRSGEISVSAPPDRVICPGSVPQVTDVSDNGGSRGNVVISPNARTASVPVSCSGAGVGAGRRWFNATLVIQTCVMITEEMILDATLECAEKLQ